MGCRMDFRIIHDAPYALTSEEQWKDYFRKLPLDTTQININGSKSLTEIPDLSRFLFLETLNVKHNRLKTLPALPASLKVLDCACNKLTELPKLPETLEYIDCSCNSITQFPQELPAHLETLKCDHNQLTLLPELPSQLKTLECASNYLSVLPALPATLEKINCQVNELTVLPPLPLSLTELNCRYNLLQRLPPLPNGLMFLGCVDNRLAMLPDIPSSVKCLWCEGNPYVFDYNLGFTSLASQVNRYNQMLRNARHLFYCLKFRRAFFRWFRDSLRRPSSSFPSNTSSSNKIPSKKEAFL